LPCRFPGPTCRCWFTFPWVPFYLRIRRTDPTAYTTVLVPCGYVRTVVTVTFTLGSGWLRVYALHTHCYSSLRVYTHFTFTRCPLVHGSTHVPYVYALRGCATTHDCFCIFFFFFCCHTLTALFQVHTLTPRLHTHSSHLPFSPFYTFCLLHTTPGYLILRCRYVVHRLHCHIYDSYVQLRYMDPICCRCCDGPFLVGYRFVGADSLWTWLLGWFWFTVTFAVVYVWLPRTRWFVTVYTFTTRLYTPHVYVATVRHALVPFTFGCYTPICYPVDSTQLLPLHTHTPT